jgi:hypothetical protein
MGTIYGKFSHLITPADIDTVIIDTSGRTSFTISTDSTGGAVITCTMTADSSNSCNSNNGIFVQLKDVFDWTRVACNFFSTGTAACWGWNGDNTRGVGMTSSQQRGNLLPYNESLGDTTKYEFNVWELPEFAKKFLACDNNADNYMRFNSSGRSFNLYSRRDNMNLLAGPSHARTCSGTGTVVISRIFIT